MSSDSISNNHSLPNIFLNRFLWTLGPLPNMVNCGIYKCSEHQKRLNSYGYTQHTILSIDSHSSGKALANAKIIKITLTISRATQSNNFLIIY